MNHQNIWLSTVYIIDLSGHIYNIRMCTAHSLPYRGGVWLQSRESLSGDLSQGGFCPGGFSVQGSLSRELSVQGGVCPEESLCSEGLCLGGLCLGVSVQWGVSVQRKGSVQMVSVWGVSVQGGLCLGEVTVQGRVSVQGVSVQGLVSVWVFSVWVVSVWGSLSRGRYPLPPVDRQTPVKLLPCLKLLWSYKSNKIYYV